LVSEHRDFEEQVVLAKTSKAVFHRPALPGDTLELATEIVNVEPEGAMVRGTSHIRDGLHAEVELFFAYLDDRLDGIELISPADVLSMLRMFGLYDVAKAGDGTPLPVPPRLLDAERRQYTGPASATE
jgi:3-hydroxyacyl-[acyl-carrier-protein] dehydratase